jgi:hypothetical protein
MSITQSGYFMRLEIIYDNILSVLVHLVLLWAKHLLLRKIVVEGV